MFFQGVRNDHAHDDTQLLLHHTWPAAGHDHAPVVVQHTSFLDH